MTAVDFFDKLNPLLVSGVGNSFKFAKRHYGRQIYVYDKTAISHYAIGDEFTVLIEIGHQSLKSRYSGTVWRPNDKGVVFSYRGETFAALNNENLAQLVNAIQGIGCQLYAIARVDSWYDSDDRWPSVKVLMPGDFEIGGIATAIETFHSWPVSGREIVDELEQRKKNEWARETAKLLGVDTDEMESAIRVWIPRHSDRTTSFMRQHRRWSGLCTILEIPQPASSKAKPCLQLISSKGSLVYESKVRRKEYKMLYKARGSQVRVALKSFPDDFHELTLFPYNDSSTVIRTSKKTTPPETAELRRRMAQRLAAAIKKLITRAGA